MCKLVRISHQEFTTEKWTQWKTTESMMGTHNTRREETEKLIYGNQN